jgi:hypothetical protein
MITRKTLVWALCIALAALAWNTVSAHEVVTLHILGPGASHHYARVWVVDAKPYVWIRAETPERNWLEPLRASPDIYLWRGEQRYAYRAAIRDDLASVDFVDELFRAKYGLMDRLREPFRAKPIIPIQLEPR